MSYVVEICPACRSPHVTDHCKPDVQPQCDWWRCRSCESYGSHKTGRWVKGRKAP